jgi:hypothetical protein
MEQTSIESYHSLNLGPRQTIVLEALKKLCLMNGDATDIEIANYLRKDSNYVRPRRFELCNNLKLIGYSQTRQCKITGRNCMAWKVLNTQLTKYNL